MPEVDARTFGDLVRRAYIYAFPVYEMYRTRHAMVYDGNNLNRVDLNRFHHARKLSDHTTRQVTTPNNDTLYSIAWLDLSREPVVLSVPDTGGRYYSIQFLDFFTNTFAIVGRRITGTRKGAYVVVGPQRTGSTPAELPLIKAPTNAVWLVGRTMVDDEAGLATVHSIQDQYRLTRLSAWTGAGEGQRSPGSAPPAPDPNDPWDFFKIVNIGLTENPPPADETPFLAEFARIHVGPGQAFDPTMFDEEQHPIILTAMAEAAKEISSETKRFTKVREGWTYWPSNMGNFGKDFLMRAAVALRGLGALSPEEAIYFSTRTDKEGTPLNGQRQYRLHFDDGGLPPVDAFWSLSMYEVMPDQRAFFIDNSIHRYSIGDRTKGLKFGKDGSLDIYLQYASPGKRRESNWLPAPRGRFSVALRAYQPRDPLLKEEYSPPGIQCVD